MPIGFYKVTTVLNALTGLPEDACVNDWYFGSIDSGTHDDAANAITTMLNAFFNTTPTGQGGPISGSMGESLTRVANGHQHVFYFTDDLSNPVIWGSPVETRSWTLGAANAGDVLPREIAICCSFHASLVGVPETAPGPGGTIIRPAARRRGRIYLGPLQALVMAEDATTHEAEVSTTTMARLNAAMEDLYDDSVATNYAWSVYSKTAEEFNAVVAGYVDNAFDIQRRRGLAPSARSTWTG